MNYIKAFIVPMLLLSSQMLLSSESIATAIPLVPHSAEQPKCFLKRCLVGCLLVTASLGGGVAAGWYGVFSNRPQSQHHEPTPIPTPYYPKRLSIHATDICCPAYPKYVYLPNLCLPDASKFPEIEHQVRTVCPNSTNVELRVYPRPSTVPNPACYNVDTMLQKVNTTLCLPPSDPRRRYYHKRATMAGLRKPQ